MAKLTLNNLGSGTAFQTAIATINANNDAIEAAWENNLSRDGTSPNTMTSNLDMNSNRILNLPLPVNTSEPLRLGDITDVNGQFITATTGTSGHTVPYLDGNNTWSGTNTFSAATTFNNTVAITNQVALSSTLWITSSSALALAVGRQGTTDPAFRIDASTASSATGLKITAAAAASGVDLSAISSGTNENLTLNAKSSGNIVLQNTATGTVSVGASGRFSVNPATGYVGIGSNPTGDGLTIVTNGATANQARFKDSTGGHTGALCSQNNAGSFLFNNQDNASIEFYTNNGSGEQFILGTAGNGLKIGAGAPNGGTGGLGVVGAIVSSNSVTTGGANGGFIVSDRAGVTNNGWTIYAASNLLRFFNNQAAADKVTFAVNTGDMSVLSTTSSTSTTTGALTVAGGLGVAGSINSGGTVSGVQMFATNGYFVTAPTTKTGTSATLGNSDVAVIFNPSGAFTVTLPSAASNSGKILYFKLIAAQTVASASSNVVPLAGGAAGTAILAATAGKYCTLISDGTNWQIFAAN